MLIYRRLLQNLRMGEETVVGTRTGPRIVTRELLSADAWRKEWDAAPHVTTEENETVVITERFLPKPRVIILGGGHVAVPLAAMGSLLNFDVTVFDDRPSFANKARFPTAGEVICDSFEKVTSRVTVRKRDAVVIVTRGHRHDQSCLRDILKGEIPDYMGMIGSRRRAEIVRQQMKDEGFAPEIVGQLHSPIGLAIGSVTPEEIALSIMAEIVQQRRCSYRGDFADVNLIERLAALEAEMESGGNKQNAAIVTILSTKGSTPREAGAKMAVFRDGSVAGSIGGGCAEADVLRDARDIAANGGFLFKTVDMTDSAEEDGMVCGGTMSLLIESLTQA